MSKLVDKLRRVQTTEVRRMGFGNATETKNPSMVVIAAVPAGSAAPAFEAGADFVLVPAGYDPAAAVKAASVDGKAIGLDWPEATASGIESSGADFVLFDLDRAGASIIRAEDIAKVVVVDPSMEDSPLRTLDALNLDAAVIRAEFGDLTVRDLLGYRRVSAFLRMPVMIQVDHVPPAELLATLRDSGIDGVILTDGDVAALRRTVDGLPPRVKRKRGRGEALVPRVGAHPGGEDEDDGEDDE